MTTRILIIASFLGMLAACGGPGESADVPEAQPAGVTNVDIGEHIVHFNAQTAVDLPEEVARAYEIGRSPNTAMFSISVLKESDGSAVRAEVTPTAVNLTGQRKLVKFKEISEQDAIYYIGWVESIENMETLIFDISVKPDGVDSASEVRFKRQFFTDK